MSALPVCCLLWSALTFCSMRCSALRSVLCPALPSVLCSVLSCHALSCPVPASICCVLCCAVLCCAVLCCAVLCCAVLCCAVLCALIFQSVCSWSVLALLMHAVLMDRNSVAAESTDCQADRASPGQLNTNSKMQLQSLQLTLSEYLAKPPSALLQSHASSKAHQLQAQGAVSGKRPL